MIDLEMRPGTDLARLAREVRATHRSMLLTLTAALEQEAQPIIDAARQRALTQLPRRGGLAELVAHSTFTVRPIRAAGRAGIRISTADHDSRIDTQGRLRHPVFGRRDDPWAQQRVRPGWFTKAARSRTRQVRRRIDNALDDVAARLGV